MTSDGGTPNYGAGGDNASGGGIQQSGAGGALASTGSPAGTGGSGGSGGESGIGGKNDPAGSTTTGAGAGPGGPDCSALEKKVDDALDAAQACSLIQEHVGECNSNEPGKCCEVVVDQPDSQKTLAYLSALKAFNVAGCKAQCLAMVCQSDPHGSCSGDGGGSQAMGRCKPLPVNSLR
jgi:hypothetical protein